MEKNACGAEQKLNRCCRIDFGPLIAQILFKNREACFEVLAICSCISRHALKRHGFFAEYDLVLEYSSDTLSLSGTGGRTKKQNEFRSTSPLKIPKARMRSTRRRLLSGDNRLNRLSLFLQCT